LPAHKPLGLFFLFLISYFLFYLIQAPNARFTRPDGWADGGPGSLSACQQCNWLRCGRSRCASAGTRSTMQRMAAHLLYFAEQSSCPALPNCINVPCSALDNKCWLAPLCRAPPSSSSLSEHCRKNRRTLPNPHRLEFCQTCPSYSPVRLHCWRSAIGPSCSNTIMSSIPVFILASERKTAGLAHDWLPVSRLRHTN
jgi:hypothetical protein